MATNIPSFFYDSVINATRAGEVPDASFTDGMNLGASCAPGLGINTGNPDPKPQDWARIQIALASSSYIGIDSGVNDNITLWRSDGADLNDQVSFGPADALTIPGAVINAGLGNVNETGANIAAGVWAWGPVPVA